MPEAPCGKDVATDLIELANGHPFGGNLVGVKRSSKSAQEEILPCLQCFRKAMDCGAATLIW